MPRLDRSVRRIGKEDIPPITGLDAQSSYVEGYDPSTGLIPTLTMYLLTEAGEFIHTENGDFVVLE